MLLSFVIASRFFLVSGLHIFLFSWCDICNCKFFLSERKPSIATFEMYQSLWIPYQTLLWREEGTLGPYWDDWIFSSPWAASEVIKSTPQKWAWSSSPGKLVIYSLDFQGNIVTVISLPLLLFYVFENLSGLSHVFFIIIIIIHSSILSLQSIRLLPQGEKETSRKCHLLSGG